MAVRPIDAGILQDNLTDIYGDGNRLVYLKDVLGLIDEQPTLTPPNEPLTCEGCACESYPRDCYPCNTCNRNDEILSDQYRPPEGEER